MQKHPEVKLRIVGHTSSEGDPDFNQKLSQDRAQAAVDFLISRGVDAIRLTAEGKGYKESGAFSGNEKPQGYRKTGRTGAAYLCHCYYKGKLCRTGQYKEH